MPAPPTSSIKDHFAHAEDSEEELLVGEFGGLGGTTGSPHREGHRLPCYTETLESGEPGLDHETEPGAGNPLESAHHEHEYAHAHEALLASMQFPDVPSKRVVVAVQRPVPAQPRLVLVDQERPVTGPLRPPHRADPPKSVSPEVPSENELEERLRRLQC